MTDGYTKFVDLDGVQVWYRPLSELQRREVELTPREARPALLRLMLQDCLVRSTDEFTDEVQAKLLNHVLESTDPDEEAEDARNLALAKRVMVKHPHLIPPPCEHCKANWYDPRSGKTATSPDGTSYLPRPNSVPLLCETADGCPLGHHTDPVGPSKKNLMALSNYLMTRGSRHQWDEIERQNAAIIEGSV